MRAFNSIVFDASGIDSVLACLQALGDECFILTNDDVMDEGNLKSRMDYWVDLGKVEVEEIPKFEVVLHIPDFGGCSNRYLIKVKNEVTVKLFLLANQGGVDVDIFSSDLEISALDNLYEMAIVDGWVSPPMDMIYDNLEKIEALCDFSLWFGLPNPQYDTDILVISRHKHILDKLVSCAESAGERIFEDSDVGARVLMDPNESGLYYADARTELVRYSPDILDRVFPRV